MNIKNYTSDIAPEKSITNIEKYLVMAGATDISKSYDNGICSAIKFRIVSNGLPIFFKLPAKIDGCFKFFMNGKTYNTQKIRETAMKQAEKTAWKLISDWVEIQVSMIKLNQAEVIEIFLPYAYNTSKNETFYEQLKSNDFKQISN